MIRSRLSPQTGIILLAAGESRRFGSPKQLALYRGKPLIRHAAEMALQAGLGPVHVVLGAVHQPCREVLAGLDLHIIHHAGWRTGMGGSISAGIRPWLGRRERPDGVILLPADQARVTPDHLRTLAEAAAGGSHSIVASAYSGQLGAPAWFAPDKFFRLLLLEGKQGAKSLIAREPRLHRVEFQAAAYDIDTPGDLPPGTAALFGGGKPKPRAA